MKNQRRSKISAISSKSSFELTMGDESGASLIQERDTAAEGFSGISLLCGKSFHLTLPLVNVAKTHSPSTRNQMDNNRCVQAFAN